MDAGQETIGYVYAEKRLAVQVEDHPLEYMDFEGVIPDGAYGAGAVLIWDRGTWIPRGDPEKAYKNGALKSELEGERLRGGWMLVRMGAKGKKNNWLLIKEHDPAARRGSGDAVAAENRTSVITGRDIEGVT